MNEFTKAIASVAICAMGYQCMVMTGGDTGIVWGS